MVIADREAAMIAATFNEAKTRKTRRARSKFDQATGRLEEMKSRGVAYLALIYFLRRAGACAVSS